MRSLFVGALSLLVSWPLGAMSGHIYGGGKPVAGAKVSARVPMTPDRAMARLLNLTQPDPAVLASTTTNAAGAFHLDIKGADVVTLVVSAEGFLPATLLELTADNEIAIPLQKLSLRPGRIRVAGKPVADAAVSFLDNRYEILATYRTDQTGTYSSPDAIGWAASACVTHRDYAPVCRASYSEAGLAPADFTLTPGTAVSGRVIDENGKPVAGAVVRIDQWPMARSEADGSFKIAHAPESTKLYASGGGRAGSTPMIANATVTVSRGRTLSGSVTDAKGRALAGVPVMTGGDSAGVWLGTVTDGKGAFEFTSLVPDDYSIGVSAPLAWEVEHVKASLKQGDAKKTLVVRDAPFVRGTVVDESRKPVEGAMVSLLPAEMPVLYGRIAQFPSTITGTGGKFRLRSWGESEGTLQLTASKRGFAVGTMPVKGTATVSITLPAGVEVSGVVVDSEGNPQSGAAVVAAAATHMLNTMPLGAALATGTLSEWTKSDARGRFAMRVNDGPHDFGVWKKGFAATDLGSVPVSSTLEPLKIVLGVPTEVRGRVVKKDGTPAREGTVTAMGTSGGAGIGQTNLGDDGSFVLDSLAAGPYTLTVQTEAGSATKSVTAPATDVVIELPALITIAGRVTDKATGAAIQSFSVTTSNMEARHYRPVEIAEASGAFTASVPPGSVEVDIRAPGYTKASRTVIVTSQPVEGIDFALERGRKITGRVTGENGAPINEATITLGREEYSGEMATTGEDGSYELEGVPVSELVVSVRGPGYLTSVKRLPAGSQDQRLDVALSAGRRLSGRVVDVSGGGVADVSVSASSEAHDADDQTTTSGHDGSFTLSGLIDAHYDLYAEKEGAGAATLTDVDTKSAKPVVLRLVTVPTGTIHGIVEGASGGNWMMGMVHAQAAGGGSASAQISRDGTYRLEHVPAGEVEVGATLIAADREISSKKMPAIVAPGSDVELNLPPAGNISITGRVTSNGTPLPSQSVVFSTVDGYGRWRAMTGEDGSYSITGLDAGRYWIQAGESNAREYFQTQHDITGSGVYDINTARTNVQGRVVDATGAPVPDAAVSATSNDPARRGTTAQATTDAFGRFTLALPSASSYQVTAARQGYVNGTAELDAHSMLSEIVITLRSGEGQTIVLADARSGAVLSGYVVVTDETGKITFPVTPEKQEDGSLHLALPDGRYRISASASEYASRTVRVNVPSPPIRMTLTPGGTLVVNAPTDARHLVRLVMPDGEEYVRCYCNGIAEIRLEGAVTRVPNVAPGVYRMDLLDTANRVVRSYPVMIVEAQTATVDATR